jgi:hypothetical protein
MRSPDEEVERIASDIEQWLAQNPDAADTLEGIRDFWLTEATGQQPTELVREALELLARRGIVREERQHQGIPSIYCSASRGRGRRDG